MNEWILLVAVMVTQGDYKGGGAAVSTERFGPYPTEQQCRTAMKELRPDKTYLVKQAKAGFMGSAYGLSCIPQPNESK